MSNHPTGQLTEAEMQGYVKRVKRDLREWGRDDTLSRAEFEMVVAEAWMSRPVQLTALAVRNARVAALP